MLYNGFTIDLLVNYENALYHYFTALLLNLLLVREVFSA